MRICLNSFFFCSIRLYTYIEDFHKHAAQLLYCTEQKKKMYIPQTTAEAAATAATATTTNTKTLPNYKTFPQYDYLSTMLCLLND